MNGIEKGDKYRIEKGIDVSAQSDEVATIRLNQAIPTGLEQTHCAA